MKLSKFNKSPFLYAILFALLPLGTSVASAKKSRYGGAEGAHHVNGHFKKNGTYVAPHHATNPNNTQRDNWSSKPNVNPHNGKQGSKEPNY